jgi:hypothetical protein
MAKHPAKRSTRIRPHMPGAAAPMAASHSPIYEPTADPNTWQECLWSPSLNQYVCHDIPLSELPEHVARPRKYLALGPKS